MRRIIKPQDQVTVDYGDIEVRMMARGTPNSQKAAAEMVKEEIERGVFSGDTRVLERAFYRGCEYGRMNPVSVPFSNSGTPDSLILSIMNGYDPALPTRTAVGEMIEANVRDFLAQKFTTVLLAADENTATALSVLWTSITGRKLNR